MEVGSVSTYRCIRQDDVLVGGFKVLIRSVSPLSRHVILVSQAVVNNHVREPSKDLFKEGTW